MFIGQAVLGLLYVHIRLWFLSQGKIRRVYPAQGENTDYQIGSEVYKISKQIVQSADQLSFQLARSGGVAVRFRLMD